MEYIVDCDVVPHPKDPDASLVLPISVNGHVHERLIRCRDCKHYSHHEWVLITDVEHVCHFWHGEPTKVEPDGFCKWAAPRAGDT